MRPDVIFFDLDGSLADTMPQVLHYVAGFLERDFGLAWHESAVRIPEMLRLPAQEMFAGMMALGGIDVASMAPDEAAALIDRYFMGAAAIPLTPFPEAEDVLRRLSGAGLTLFVTTNGPQLQLEQRLQESGLGAYIRRAFGTAEGVFKGPDHVRLAAETLRTTAEELSSRSALVGDSEADMHMARQGGMLAIGRLTGDNGARLVRAGAQHLISDLTELVPLLARL